MTLHPSTFQYHQPTQEQLAKMGFCRMAAADYANVLGIQVPDGPDKTHVLRKLRELAMWVNVAITREADGTPRA